MDLFSADEVKKLLSDTLEKHAEVDLLVVAHVFVQQKIVRELIEKQKYSEENAKREGNRIQPEIEAQLLALAKDLEQQGKLKLDFKVTRLN